MPYEPHHESEDAIQFFQRQDRIDKRVAEILNDKHRKQAEWINARRVDPPPLKVGDLVWYLRPPNSGGKQDSRWLGPAAIVEREGERSYVVELKPQYYMKAPRSMLKLYKQDTVIGKPMEMYYHRRTEPVEEAMPDEWLVDKILEHKVERGQFKFLTQWQGSDEHTWEPVGNFIHRYSSDFVRYCRKKGILMELVQFLTAS